MGWGSKAGDWAFKGLTAGLGLATIYLTATFSVNVYRGLAWHNSQSVDCKRIDREEEEDEALAGIKPASGCKQKHTLKAEKDRLWQSL